MTNVIARRLSTLELFGGCRRSQLATIDQLGATIVVPPGRALCTEGTPGAEFFVLVDGLVDVRTATGTHALLHPGAWFGETALIDKSPRRATVTTRTESTVMVFGKREFRTLLAIAPQVRAHVQRSAALVVHGAVPTRRPWYQPMPSVGAHAMAATG